MALLWFGLPALVALVVLAFIRRRYGPDRTVRRLVLPAVLVERACTDAMLELASLGGPPTARRGGRELQHDRAPSPPSSRLYTSPFEPACDELLKVRYADVVALGLSAARHHHQLTRVVRAWNRGAGQEQSLHAVLPSLLAAREAAHGLLCELSPRAVSQATDQVEGRVLFGVVTRPPDLDTCVN